MQSMKTMHDIAETLGGLVVTSVLPGSPSARAGVRYGDILLRYNGFPTPSFVAYADAKMRPADGMRITVFRDGLELELALDASVAPDTSPTSLFSALDHLVSARLFGSDGTTGRS